MTQSYKITSMLPLTNDYVIGLSFTRQNKMFFYVKMLSCHVVKTCVAMWPYTWMPCVTMEIFYY